MFNWPAVAKFEDRLYQVFGERPDLVPVGKALTGFSIKGYVAALAEQGPTRGSQNVFVNRRIVKDKTIAHAIIEAYSSASIKERSPEVHLFLEIPADRVDVNVHPDEGGGALPRSVVHSRGGEARRRRRDRQGRRAGAAAAAEQLSRPEPDGAVDSRMCWAAESIRAAGRTGGRRCSGAIRCCGARNRGYRNLRNRTEPGPGAAEIP